ncbi:MAG: integrase core domain-containing protein [Brevundimonas sp.]|uniref:integrase core domain-containing protein n=1 Tax=Brevundimonas sp. TaxID=1871086 RepID=UPI00248A1EA5|nr:integrase core domain-containing protein [Brevundimonas sp.]MDI1328165.1 integrase core domain-containing protein [Brevundimonas sp.]
MGQILHGSATTTHAVRAAIQRSKAPLKELAARHGLNHKTVAKWRKRAFVQDAPMGPKTVRSTVLSPEEEAIVVAFRKHTLLPLDDCLYALQATLPRLTRSSLHLCLKRHGISRLPEIAADFLRAVIDAVPYKIHTLLTDNGVQFGDMPQHRSGPTARYRVHKFDRVCFEHGVEHRFTKPNHPWTTGQVERMNRTLKEATVRRYHYNSHQQLRQHLAAFLDAYNFAKRLKTLQGLTPYEAICKAWADEPDRFRYDPTHLTSGLNT